MKRFLLRYRILPLFLFALFRSGIVFPQTNLLLNGGFEDINTCTEYTAQCGVEAWFYLKDVKAQMLSNETGNVSLGDNSFAIFYNWNEYTHFTPIIGTILPCGLQKGHRYIFKGILSAKLNPRLLLKPGVCMGEKFYVPRRNFSKEMRPDSILHLEKMPGVAFYRFEYSFTATGNEKYLTFGTFIEEDITTGRKKLSTPQNVALVLDNFQLLPEDEKETRCDGFMSNKEIIYDYNYRHKEMDYSLFGKGELAIAFPQNDSSYITQIKEPPAAPQPDTLELGDVFFDFNKADLKPAAVTMLANYFIRNEPGNLIDSIYIEGHTDSIGSDKRNLELSRQRCESVKDWLSLNHITSNNSFFIHPFGESKPIAPNNTAKGRSLNRRVEIIIFRKRE